MNLQSSIFLYVIIIFSAILHEYAHAWAANQQGDQTAKYAGRLTLNPLAHIDWWGTVLMPLLLLYFFGMFFGYAKPVPINPYNFRHQRQGMIWVSVAGVAANFFLAVAFGLFIRFMPGFYLNELFGAIAIVNIWLGLFNLLPFPPLDGSKLLMALVDYRGSKLNKFIELASTPAGLIIAIFVAMTFLPYISRFIFGLIVGS
ncbi:MAG: Transmembrane protein [Parcubacteria group bacterium GW2011_GWA2_42_11]|nr:MAG: Transmembrane protein [Parcubacteria group bacterium GW2011_GWA2_42_11]KKT76492.1 MAG: Transmembrane protein [Parcubacteria group bacterium GW2011_GWF2_44_7]